MATGPDCRCGHPGRRHFIRHHLGRSGACMDKGCHCAAFGMPEPEAPKNDPTRPRPVTPPRRQF